MVYQPLADEEFHADNKSITLPGFDFEKHTVAGDPLKKPINTK